MILNLLQHQYIYILIQHLHFNDFVLYTTKIYNNKLCSAIGGITLRYNGTEINWI